MASGDFAPAACLPFSGSQQAPGLLLSTHLPRPPEQEDWPPDDPPDEPGGPSSSTDRPHPLSATHLSHLHANAGPAANGGGGGRADHEHGLDELMDVLSIASAAPAAPVAAPAAAPSNGSATPPLVTPTAGAAAGAPSSPFGAFSSIFAARGPSQAPGSSSPLALGPRLPSHLASSGAAAPSPYGRLSPLVAATPNLGLYPLNSLPASPAAVSPVGGGRARIATSTTDSTATTTFTTSTATTIPATATSPITAVATASVDADGDGDDPPLRSRRAPLPGFAHLAPAPAARAPVAATPPPATPPLAAPAAPSAAPAPRAPERGAEDNRKPADFWRAMEELPPTAIRLPPVPPSISVPEAVYAVARQMHRMMVADGAAAAGDGPVVYASQVHVGDWALVAPLLEEEARDAAGRRAVVMRAGWVKDLVIDDKYQPEGEGAGVGEEGGKGRC